LTFDNRRISSKEKKDDQKVKSMIQLEYDKDSVFLNSGIALSEKGETKEIGIDETFGDLQKPINGKDEFALP
jgi:hypothetical protein